MDRGATIATRYLAVRRQFALDELDGVKDAEEAPVLNYTSVQYRVLPQIALAYALHFTGKYMHRMYCTFRLTG